MAAITDIIQWAKISQPLSRYDEATKKAAVGGSVPIDHDMKLYLVRKDLEYSNAQFPSTAGTTEVGNFLLHLIGPYLLKAQQTTGGSGVISPVTQTGGLSFDYLIPVSGGVPMFANATDYNDSRIIGHNLEIFWNDNPRFLLSGEWTYTPTGIRMLIPGFDATANTYDFKIFIRDPFVTSGTGTEVTRSFQYTGVGGETSFTNLLLNGATIVDVARGTPYQIINSGTPSASQVLVTLGVNNLSNGTITFSTLNPIGAGEIVTVIFSKAT